MLQRQERSGDNLRGHPQPPSLSSRHRNGQHHLRRRCHAPCWLHHRRHPTLIQFSYGVFLRHWLDAHALPLRLPLRFDSLPHGHPRPHKPARHPLLSPTPTLVAVCMQPVSAGDIVANAIRATAVVAAEVIVGDGDSYGSNHDAPELHNGIGGRHLVDDGGDSRIRQWGGWRRHCKIEWFSSTCKVLHHLLR